MADEAAAGALAHFTEELAQKALEYVLAVIYRRGVHYNEPLVGWGM